MVDKRIIKSWTGAVVVVVVDLQLPVQSLSITT